MDKYIEYRWIFPPPLGLLNLQVPLQAMLKPQEIKFSDGLIELVDEPAPHLKLLASHAGAGKNKPKKA